MNLNKFWIAAAFLLSFGLAACAGNEVQTEVTATPALSSTPLPEATTTAEPTDTPPPTDTPLPPTATHTPLPTDTVVPTATAVAVPTDPPAPHPTASPTPEGEFNAVGFTIDPMPGFQVVEDADQVRLISEDGEIILTMFTAGLADPAYTLQELLDYFVASISASLDEYSVADSFSISIDDIDGLAADVTGSTGGQEMTGRAAVVIPEEGQVFVLFGSAFNERWETEGVNAFDTVINSLAFDQPEEKASTGSSSTWDRYQPRTLAELDELTGDILSEGVDSGAFADLRDAPVLYLEYAPEHEYPSVVHAVYTGEIRNIPPLKLRGIQTWWRSRGLDMTEAELNALFAREMRVTDGANEYWLPVQELLIPIIEDEFSPGDEIELFVAWAGAIIESGEFDRIYMVNEFISPE